MIEKVYPTNRKKTKSECPNCGCEISYHSTFESVLSGKFDNPGGGAWSVNSFSPIRKADLTSDVAVPAVQALISSALSLPASSLVLVYLEYEWYFSFPLGALVMGAYWIKGVRRLELERGESREFSYEPVDAQDAAGSHGGKVDQVSLEVISKDDDFRAAMKIVDLPAGMSVSEFMEFCRDILAGKSLARKEWAGGGKQFSRDQYDDLMAAMSASGLVIQVAGRGRALTSGGRRAIARMMRQA